MARKLNILSKNAELHLLSTKCCLLMQRMFPLKNIGSPLASVSKGFANNNSQQTQYMLIILFHYQENLRTSNRGLYRIVFKNSSITAKIKCLRWCAVFQIYLWPMKYCTMPASLNWYFDTLRHTVHSESLPYFPFIVWKYFKYLLILLRWYLLWWYSSIDGFIESLLETLLDKRHMGNRLPALEGRKPNFK